MGISEACDLQGAEESLQVRHVRVGHVGPTSLPEAAKIGPHDSRPFREFLRLGPLHPAVGYPGIDEDHRRAATRLFVIHRRPFERNDPNMVSHLPRHVRMN